METLFILSSLQLKNNLFFKVIDWYRQVCQPERARGGYGRGSAVPKLFGGKGSSVAELPQGRECGQQRGGKGSTVEDRNPEKLPEEWPQRGREPR